MGDTLISAYLKGEGTAEDIATVMAYAKGYFKITLVGALPFALSQAYASTMRETSDRLIPMISTISAVVVNLIFNYLLIFGKLGFPVMDSVASLGICLLITKSAVSILRDSVGEE